MLVITESKLDDSIPTNLITIPGLEGDRKQDNGYLTGYQEVYLTKNQEVWKFQKRVTNQEPGTEWHEN